MFLEVLDVVFFYEEEVFVVELFDAGKLLVYFDVDRLVLKCL